MAKIFYDQSRFLFRNLSDVTLVVLIVLFSPIIIGFFFYEFSPRPHAHELQIFSSMLVYRRVNGSHRSLDEPADRVRNRDTDAKLE